MKASKNNPVYTSYIVTASGTRYNLDNVKVDLQVSQGKDDLATQVNVSCANAKIGSGHLSGQVSVKDRIYVYANDGTGAKEKFRGFIWTKDYVSDVEKELSYSCYDNLIYFQESKDSFYFAKGTQTSAMVSAIAAKWGFQIFYEYESIAHSKTSFRGQRISDIIIELLEEVKKQTGAKYVIYSEKDKMFIKRMGTNSTVYKLERRKNALSTKSRVTLDGVITKVVITGNADDDKKEPVLATVDGDTAKYGTLQEMISKDKDTSLDDAKKEANEILKEKGQPIEERSVKVIDIPWVMKGDKVYLSSGDLVGYFLVTSIEHDATQKIMSVDLERV